MATWQAIVGGTTYNLSDRNPFDVVTVTGVGSAPVRRLSQRGPLQHGETDIGYRLDPRSINLVLAFAPATLALADTARDTLARIFAPGNTPFNLRYTRDDGAVRQIDCYAVGMVDMPVTDEDRIGVMQRVAVQLVAPEPLWYDAAANIVVLTTTVPDVFTAGGMIASADVVNSVTSPALATAFGTGNVPLNTFTVMARTTKSTAGEDLLFQLNAYNSVSPAYGTFTFSNNVGAALPFLLQYPGYGIINNATMMSGGLHLYWFVYDGSFMRVFEDDTLKGEKAFVLSAYDELVLATSFWNGVLAGDPWDQDITHAAYYSRALSQAERGAIQTLIDAAGYFASVNNAGSFDEYPIIVLSGPLTNPIITNVATGEVLDFTGTTIAENTSFTIDLRYGHKSVIDTTAANRISALTSASDLATFHLQPGYNLLTMVASGTDANSAASIIAYDRFLSL
jgi:hypothetical protein